MLNKGKIGRRKWRRQPTAFPRVQMSEVKRDYKIGYGKPPRGRQPARAAPQGDVVAVDRGAERAGLCHDRRQAAQDHQAPGDRHADGQRIGERQSARDQDAVRHDEGGRAEGRRGRTARAAETDRDRPRNHRSVCRPLAPPDRGRGCRSGSHGRRRCYRAARLTMPEPAVAVDAAWSECAALLHDDFTSFAAYCFRELNPRARLAMNWHVEVMAGKLMAVREGRIRRLIICVPPRHLKSLLASVAFPAWCLGHDPSAQIICTSYAQDLADKLSRDCRRIITADRYQKLFPATRLSPTRQAVPEFETTAQGFRIATSVGGVLTGRGADMIIIDDPLKPEEALSQAQRQAANEWYDHTLYSRLNDKLSGAIVVVMHRLHEDDLA